MMNIFLNEEDIEEIKPVKESPDNGIVINPGGILKDNPKQEIDEVRKEIIGMDAVNMTVRDAAVLHGVGKSNVAKYANGEGLTPDGRANVLALRNNIQDVAIAKLMDTLNLINPDAIEKERDKIAVVAGLSQVIDKLNSKDNNEKPVVHLHMYAPVQKNEKDYKVIEA